MDDFFFFKWPFKGNYRKLMQHVWQELASILQEHLFTQLLVWDLNDIAGERIIELCNPQAAAELCVIERAGLHHSLHGRPYEPRERQNESETEREGGWRRDTILTEWMIHHMIVLDGAALSDCCTALSNCPPFHKPWCTDLLHSTIQKRCGLFSP